MIFRQPFRPFAVSASLLALAASTWPAAGQYSGTDSGCIQCHANALPRTDFCSTTAASVWARDDKHANAFFLLHETDPARPEQGAAKRALVKQILGFALSDAFTDASFSQLKADDDLETKKKVAVVKSCLRCHATWPKAADEQFAHDPPVSLELGVSCQACHGPGQKWDQPHRSFAWRTVTPEAKATLGFIDCRSPHAKAQLCASCHVGSIAEDKFVRHEWYAAGHPPLPSFELASFEAQMPVHWRSLREKGDFAFRAAIPPNEAAAFNREKQLLVRNNGVPADAFKQSYLDANFPDAVAKGLDPSADLPATKDAIVGGAAVFAAYVRQVGDYAGQAAEQSGSWPELALFDCAACHHELRRRLPVATVPRRHPPGRPPLADWPQVLARLAAQQVGGYDEAETARHWSAIDQLLEPLEKATTARPFGDAAAMQKAAGPLADALLALAREAGQTRFDEAAAKNALTVLTEPSFRSAYDFSSARQTGWAITAMASDLDPPTAQQLLEGETGAALSLQLPSGPNRSVMDNMQRWLPAAARFDPHGFNSELPAIRAALNKP